MPIAKKLTKRAAARRNKCPHCGSRSYKAADKLTLIQRIIFAGCKPWVCLKCGRKWGA